MAREFAKALEILVAGKNIVTDTLRPGNIEVHQPLDGHHHFAIECLSLVSGSSGADPGTSEELNALHAHLGDEIEIKAKYQATVGSRSEGLHFKGLITSVEATHDFEHGYAVWLRGHSPTVKLDDVPRHAMYEEMKLLDVAQKAAGDVGLKVDGDAPPYQFATLYQRGETDWDFLRRMMAQQGRLLYYDGQELHSVKDFKGGAAAKLSFSGSGELLYDFGLRMKTAPTSFQISAWGDASPRPLVGQTASPRAPGHSFGKTAVDASKRVFGRKGDLRPEHSPGEQVLLDADAQSVGQSQVSDLLEGHGHSDALALAPGTIVEIEGFGEYLSGKYVITEVIHRFESGQLDYRNEFRCVASDGWAVHRELRTVRRPEMWTAEVVDNDDPDQRGRVKVRFSHEANEIQSGWARVATLFGNSTAGWFNLPEIGDEVLVSYSDGDLRYPVVVGTLLARDKTGDEQKTVIDDLQDGKPQSMLFVSRSGHRIHFRDHDKDESIEIVTAREDCRLLMQAADGDVKIDINSNGQLNITTEDVCTVTAKKDVTVKSDKSISLDAAEGITLKAGKDVTMEAQGKFEVKAGTDFAAQANANAEMKAGSGSIKASGSGVDVKGAMVKLN